MRLLAFQGVRYAGVGRDPGELAAPPFDQINDALRRELHRRDPHHFAHLTRPVAAAGENAFRRATLLHRSWLAEGATARDEAPCVYPYEIRLAGGGRRLGVCGLIGLEPAGSGVIRPHEHTVPKTVHERLDLLRAMRVDLEPILLLSEDRGDLDALLEAEVESADPIVEHRDPDGHRHRLFRVDEPHAIRRFQEVLSPHAAVIADGHHRYRVAQLFSEQEPCDASSPAAAKLAVITSVASPGLTIDPIHRLLHVPVAPPRVDGVVLERRAWEGSGGAALAAAVAAAEQPAVGVRSAGRPAEIWRLDPAAGPRRLAPAASRMAVVLLHYALLPRWGLEEAENPGPDVEYRSDPDELWQSIEEGRANGGVWLPPMRPESFSKAVSRGDLLPPKSTRFMPKVASGLVWAPHDSEIL